MATGAGLNKNSSAVKRILSEARELQNDDSTEYTAAPLEEDIFEWHCTIRGPSDTEFEGGLYHCRILLPTEYPFKAPSIMLLTPNGRFELNKKICISFTSYHEELWQPAWGVRTAIIGLQGFFPLKGESAVGVGAIEYPISERKRLAALSRDWTCPHCQVPNKELLPDPSASNTATASPSSPKPPPESVIAPDSSTHPPYEPKAIVLESRPEATEPSLESASIPATLPPIVETTPPAEPPTSDVPAITATVETITASSVPIIPVQPVFTAPAVLPEQVDESVGRAPPTATATTSTSTSPSPTTSSIRLVPTVQNGPNQTTPRSAHRSNGAGRRPPIWLDATILFFSLMLAIVAGKRFMHLWEIVREEGAWF